MLNAVITRLQRNRPLAIAALVFFTVLFGAGSYLAQTAIEARQGGLAMLGVLGVLLGLIGQLVALAAVFKHR